MDLGDILWAMLAFFFWFMVIWIFIAVFADIFRRNDLSGWGKAGWILLIFILPFLGLLIYMIARPRMTEQDKQMIQAARERERRAPATRRSGRGGQAREAPRRGQDHRRGVRVDEAASDAAGVATSLEGFPRPPCR